MERDPAETPPRPRPPRRSWLAPAALLTGSVLLTVGLAEVALRFVPRLERLPPSYEEDGKLRPNEHFVADPDLGWRIRPGHTWTRETEEFRAVYRGNGHGFRASFDYVPEEPRRKIVVAGDSFTFGLGVDVEATYPALLAAAIPGALPYNLAIPAFGLDQMWQAVRLHGLPAEPDLVIVGFIGDDFGRTLSEVREDMGFVKPVFDLDDGVLVRRRPEDRPPAWWRWLDRRSNLVSLLRRLGRAVGQRAPVGRWWSVNAAILDAIAADCKAANVPVLFVYLPTRGGRSFELLARHMRASGRRFLDLATAASPDGELQFPVDGHLNPRGHRVVADAILETIRRDLPELLAATPPSSPEPAPASTAPPPSPPPPRAAADR